MQICYSEAGFWCILCFYFWVICNSISAVLLPYMADVFDLWPPGCIFPEASDLHMRLGRKSCDQNINLPASVWVSHRPLQWFLIIVIWNRVSRSWEDVLTGVRATARESPSMTWSKEVGLSVVTCSHKHVLFATSKTRSPCMNQADVQMVVMTLEVNRQIPARPNSYLINIE